MRHSALERERRSSAPNKHVGRICATDIGKLCTHPLHLSGTHRFRQVSSRASRHALQDRADIPHLVLEMPSRADDRIQELVLYSFEFLADDVLRSRWHIGQGRLLSFFPPTRPSIPIYENSSRWLAILLIFTFKMTITFISSHIIVLYHHPWVKSKTPF